MRHKRDRQLNISQIMPRNKIAQELQGISDRSLRINLFEWLAKPAVERI